MEASSLLVHKLQIQADKINSCINDKAGTQVAPCEKLTAAASKSVVYGRLILNYQLQQFIFL